jgi:hypothetical protein
VANPQKRKGDRAEREVAAILSDLLGVSARRELGAGRQDDCGDIRLQDTVIQVANYTDLARAVREKLPDLERQQQNAGAVFAAMFCRRRGGRYVVVMSPEAFAALWREATA